MAVTVHLNGGPWHGRTTAIPEGRDHFHIIEPNVDWSAAITAEENTPVALPTRAGTYSAVRGYPGEFEWDGWRSHD